LSRWCQTKHTPSHTQQNNNVRSCNQGGQGQAAFKPVFQHAVMPMLMGLECDNASGSTLDLYMPRFNIILEFGLMIHVTPTKLNCKGGLTRACIRCSSYICMWRWTKHLLPANSHPSQGGCKEAMKFWRKPKINVIKAAQGTLQSRWLSKRNRSYFQNQQLRLNNCFYVYYI
jgi:hypothetical protein